MAGKMVEASGNLVKPRPEESVKQSIADIGYGRYQLHCFVLCSGFIVAEASLLSMTSALMKSMGASVGEATRLGEASLVACLFAGLGCGTFLSGLLADPAGRRLPMTLGYMGMTATALALACSPAARAVMHTLLFLLGIYAGSGIPISLITLAEVSPASWRGCSAAVLGLSFSMGELWSGLGLRFLFPEMDYGPWRAMMLWAASPSVGMFIFGLVSPVSRHDTAQWHAAVGQNEALASTLNLMAKMNGRADDLHYVAEEFPIVCTDAKSESKQVCLESCSRIARSLRKAPLPFRLACMAVLFIAKDFTFYGMSVYWPITWRHWDRLHLLPATELCLTALLGVPGVLLAVPIMWRCPRREALAIMASLCMLACLLMTRLKQQWEFGLLGALLFKLSFPTWQMVCMLLPTELFPTEVRGAAYSCVAFVGRAGTVLAPMCIGVSRSLFLRLAATLALFSVLGAYLLPETSSSDEELEEKAKE